MVLNLLSNAVKFTPEGGRVTIRGRACGPLGQHRHRRYRHRHSEGRAGAARPAVRAGREPAHQEPPGLRPGARDREIADRAARRHHAHPLDPGQRHDGAAAAADRRPRRRAGRDGGSGGVRAGVRGNQRRLNTTCCRPRASGDPSRKTFRCTRGPRESGGSSRNTSRCTMGPRFRGDDSRVNRFGATARRYSRRG